MLPTISRGRLMQEIRELSFLFQQQTDEVNTFETFEKIRLVKLLISR